MLFLAALCHLLAAVTVILRVEYTPSFCHPADTPSFHCFSSTSLSVSRYWSSPSYDLSVSRYWSSPSYDLSVARVGGVSWEDVCCRAVVDEPLVVFTTSAVLHSTSPVVTFGYVARFRTGHYAWILTSLFLWLYALILCCFNALISFGRRVFAYGGYCVFIAATYARTKSTRALKSAFLCGLNVWLVFMSNSLLIVGFTAIVIAGIAALTWLLILWVWYASIVVVLIIGFYIFTITLEVDSWVVLASGIGAGVSYGFATPFFLGLCANFYVGVNEGFGHISPALQYYFEYTGVADLNLDHMPDWINGVAYAIWSPSVSFGLASIEMACDLWDTFMILSRYLNVVQLLLVLAMDLALFRFALRPAIKLFFPFLF